MRFIKNPLPVDILDIKTDIKHGRLQVIFHGNNILLKNTSSGEAVKIGELPPKEVE